MNLAAAIALVHGGGPGSGCNPEAGKCGRPSTGAGDPNEEASKHVDSFRPIFDKTVQQFKDTVGNLGVVEARLKTPESLTEKLTRKNIDLKDVPDVAGMRVTVSSMPDLYAAVAQLKGKFQIASEDNKISNPTGGIYRAYHLIATVDGKPVEMQVRTQNQSRLAVWMHDTVYKGSLRNSQVAVDYAKRLSDYFYHVDVTGKGIGPMPDCPPALQSNCFSTDIPYAGGSVK